MPTPVNIKSFTCQHFIEVEKTGKQSPFFKFICKAFPKGIPEEIRSWNKPHTSIREDQEGEFVFTPIRG